MLNLDLSMDLVALLRLFATLIAIDFVTGIVAAARQGRLKSRTCSNGLFRSIGEVLVLGTFVIVNHFIPNVHDYLVMFLWGFVAKELLSICENLVKLDVWLPQPLVKFLNLKIENIDNGEMPVVTKK